MARATGLYECPNCKQTVQFKHAQTNYTHCKSCNATLHRNEADILSIENGYYLINDAFEALQPSTTGTWQGNDFAVLGRLRLWMEETVFNYWTIQYKDGKLGILAEGYGLYSILTEQPAISNKLVANQLESFKIGKGNNLAEMSNFYLQRKFSAKRWEVEGEVLLPLWHNEIRIFEYSASDGNHLEIHAYGPKDIKAYDVVFTSFDGFGFNNLRNAVAKGKELICTGCQTMNIIKSWPYAQSCACTNCKNRYQLTMDGEFVAKGKDDKQTSFDIPLGSTGNFNGIEYEMIGCALKEEISVYRSRWKEYTLYNKVHGYAFLSEYNGHWIFVKEATDAPVMLLEEDTSFRYGYTGYSLYNKYCFKIIDTEGEFPYNIYDDEHVLVVKEFINPPTMWIKEQSNVEGINWFFAEHVSKHKVSKEFGAGLPWKTGIGAIEPRGYIKPMKLFYVAAVALLLVCIIHFCMVMGMQEKVLLENQYIVPDSLTSMNIVTEKFELKKWKSNIAFDITAPVSNSWFELGITLVNANTGEEYTLEQGVEYYFGYEGGENWSEGRTAETAYLSSIPTGTYFLQLSPSWDPSRRISRFDLKVTNDVPMDKNFWLIVLFIAGSFSIKAIYDRQVDRTRWKNSDYTPYTYAEDNE